MPVAVRSQSWKGSFTNQLTLPSEINSGDLIIIYAADHAATPPTPSGFTAYATQTVTGFGFNEMRWKISYKHASGSEANSTVTTNSSSDGIYNAAVCVVIYGHKVSNPFGNSATVIGSSNGIFSLPTTAAMGTIGKPLALFSFMSDSSASISNMPVSINTPSQSNITNSYNSAGYIACNIHMGSGNAGADLPASTSVSMTGSVFPSSAGNGELSMLWINAENSLPLAPTNLTATNSPVNFGTDATFTWTHNDAESDVQAKYQIRWRKK